MPLNWSNLRENKCPACGSKLFPKGILISEFHCPNERCGYWISEAKFKVIISTAYKPKKKKAVVVEDNAADLNLLDTKEVSEDFADSPFADREPEEKIKE